jgi:hypothetical protein
MSSRWRTPRMAPLIAKTNVPPRSSYSFLLDDCANGQGQSPLPNRRVNSFAQPRKRGNSLAAPPLVSRSSAREQISYPAKATHEFGDN